MVKFFNMNKSIIYSAICGYVALLDEDIVKDKFYNLLIKYANVNNIPERILLSNRRIYNSIDWHQLDRRKLLRLIMRDVEIINKLDIERVNFQFNEILSLLVFQPSLIDVFSVDLDKLTPMDAINLISVIPEYGNKIDLSRFTFNKKEVEVIVEKLWKSPKILEKMDLTLLDNFNTRKLILNSNSTYIDKLDVSSLTAPDWLAVLQKHPHLIEFCNIDVFKKNDCYLMVKLVKQYPYLDYLVEENIDKFSPLGWEELIIFNPKFIDICPLEKLDKKNWNHIVAINPTIEPIMNQYFFKR